VSKVSCLNRGFLLIGHTELGQEVSGGDSGRTVRVDAPFGSPPVFYRRGSSAGRDLRHFVLEMRADALTVPWDRARAVLGADCLPLSFDHGGESTARGSRRRYRQQDGCAKARIREIKTYDPPPSWMHWIMWKGTPTAAEDGMKWITKDSPRVA